MIPDSVTANEISETALPVFGVSFASLFFDNLVGEP